MKGSGKTSDLIINAAAFPAETASRAQPHPLPAARRPDEWQ